MLKGFIGTDYPSFKSFALGHTGPFFDNDDDDADRSKRSGVSEEAIQRMLDKRSGDAAAVIRQLLDEAADNRRKNREQRDRIEALEKQVPKEGSVVLNPGADLDAYNAYKAFGTPDEITAKLKKAEDLEKEVQGRTRDEELRKVAEAATLKFSVLKPLAEQAKTVFTFKEGEGDEPPAVFAKLGDKDVPIDEYIEKTWKDFDPALRDEGDGSNPPQRRSVAGVPFRGQGSGKKGGKGADPVDQYLSQTYGQAEKES